VPQACGKNFAAQGKIACGKNFPHRQKFLFDILKEHI